MIQNRMRSYVRGTKSALAMEIRTRGGAKVTVHGLTGRKL